MASESEWRPVDERDLVDPETARELLERRGIPTDCPICGANPSTPLAGEEPRYVAIDQLTSADDEPPEGFKALTLALALTCPNCGAIRLLSANVLDRFRREDADTET